MGPDSYYYQTKIVRSNPSNDPTARINSNQQKQKPFPTTRKEITKVETTVKMTHCKVCRRSFGSEKALWGHKRWCKPNGSKIENHIISVSKYDILDLGWSVTAKRGRKPATDTTNPLPRSEAASILIDISRDKNENAKINSKIEKEKAKIDESPASDENKMTRIKRDNKYQCITCGMSFPTYYALGGHKSSHRKDSVRVNSDNVKVKIEEVERKKLTGGDHVCEICGKHFLIGQALGGHKRKHWTGPAFLLASRVKKIKVQENRVPEIEDHENRVTERMIDVNEAALD